MKIKIMKSPIEGVWILPQLKLDLNMVSLYLVDISILFGWYRGVASNI